ncbi:MAG: S-layer homology domain-containing protein [Sedimentibacter sp.]|uniref:S-layer homology domain-containing protein n=1 Tax=Sedimentibacter sp. TaxID=1960295 RepID=UPI002982AEA4|nr:S-layer homology domain-containing protein [Sedimentibacter sp.]MDW5299311.1 S-layer homology domain-containing protein [Sedimentibacter sp.]
MKRKILSIILTFIMVLALIPLNASASEMPTSWKAPGSLIVSETSQFEHCTSLFFSVDPELLKFVDYEQTDHDALGINSVSYTAQIDWKLNDGNWHYTTDWDTISEYYEFDSGIYAETGYLTGETTNEVSILDLRNGDEGDTPIQKMLGNALIRGTLDDGSDNRLDLANNTIYFRVRLYVEYYIEDSEEEGFILSPWSEVLAYGKNGVLLEKPTYLEKPTISNLAVEKYPDGSPKIRFTAITPKQVQDANNYIQANDATSITVEHLININNTGWIDAEAGVWWLSGESRTVDVPVTYDNGKVVEIDKAYVQLRMRYTYDGGANVGPLQSEWSNIVSVNTPAWSNANEWATKELQAAEAAGLIPEILKGADMTKPITREEFAELAVLLYEKSSGETAAPTNSNPFNDTTNQQILKAFSLGITNGTSATTFSPKTLINREQCATMLFRVIKAMAPDGTYSMEGVKDFPDQKHISSWAIESTKYMFKIGIIKGDGAGNFMPKATTSVQEASGFGMATREAAILMALRTYESTK